MPYVLAALFAIVVADNHQSIVFHAGLAHGHDAAATPEDRAFESAVGLFCNDLRSNALPIVVPSKLETHNCLS
jgi:hypothetical protein